MFDSRSPIIKIGGYIIIGFFTIIIIISFGVPDFMSRLGFDQSTVAIINKEKIHYLEFLRYRDNVSRRFKNIDSKKLQHYILDSLIRYKLQLQKADELGIDVSDKAVKDFIKNSPMFHDKSGKFNNEYFMNALRHYRMGITEYYDTVRNELINNTMREMLRMGVGVTPDEVVNEHIIDKSRLQIKYCFVSDRDLRKRFRGDLLVSNDEIDIELKKDRSELKDPKTDRDRIRKKLADRKFEDIKREVVTSVDKLAFAGKPFGMAVAKLGGRVRISQEFKIGEPVKEIGPKGKALYTLSDSKIFRESCLAIDIGKASPAIITIDGLYVFTPTMKRLAVAKITDSEYSTIEGKLIDEKFTSIYVSMMMDFVEKSKIIKNLRLDEK